MAVPEQGQEEAYAERLNTLVDAVGSVLMVRNADTYDVLTED